MGAWIETDRNKPDHYSNKSHPLWVRGLKHHYFQNQPCKHWSHPLWVRGLKLQSEPWTLRKPRRILYGCVD